MRQLFEQKQKIITPDFLIKFPFEHPLGQPRLSNVTINATVHTASRAGASVARTTERVGPTLLALRNITGQLPSLIKAKTSVANFNIRKGSELGAIATLRKENLARFVSNYVNVVLPKFIENPPVALRPTRSGPRNAQNERRRQAAQSQNELQSPLRGAPYAKQAPQARSGAMLASHAPRRVSDFARRGATADTIHTVPNRATLRFS